VCIGALSIAVLSFASIVAVESSDAEGPRGIYPGERWDEASPESQGVDPTLLLDAIHDLEAHAGSDGVRELVVVRNGRVIWRGPDAARVHGTWSVTKSFTSTVLGLLIDEGKCTLDTRAADVAPELAEAYGDVRLRHFATMTSGYRAEGDEPRGSYTHGPSRTPFEPAPTPLFAPPGSRFAYWDSAMNELGLVLTRIAGEPLESVFAQRIAGPIGMRDWQWGDFDEIDGTKVSSGSGNQGRSIHISALDLARLGLLYLERGVWDGKRLLGEEWIDAATRVQVPRSMPLGHEESGIDGRGVYGLNWWVNGVTSAGRRLWPGAPSSAFAACGFNNNDLFVVPAWRLVVVRLGLDESDREITDACYGEFLRRLGTAIFTGSELASRGWKPQSARDEIAPICWIDERESFGGRPSLALAGNGRASTDGRFTRRVPIEPGKHYLFECRYASRDVDEPLRSILARVVWLDEDGQRIREPEYPRSVLSADDRDRGEIRDTYEAPQGAREAELELVLRWDDDGTVWFEEPRFEVVDPPASRKVRLASVHHRPRGKASAREALESFAPFVATAASKRADIVCLPEGVTIVGTGKSYADVAEPIPGTSTARLGELAREHSLWIVAGIYERAEEKIYNTAVLVDERGELRGKYRKVCLPREEIEGGITPGDDLPVFETPFGRVGLMICWDVFFPEPARGLAQRGAEIIFLPIWGGDLTLTRARAIENQVYLVSSSYDMKTAIFDRRGEILAEGTEKDPVIVVEVDLNERTLWPWLGDFGSRIPREMASGAATRPGFAADSSATSE